MSDADSSEFKEKQFQNRPISRRGSQDLRIQRTPHNSVSHLKRNKSAVSDTGSRSSFSRPVTPQTDLTPSDIASKCKSPRFGLTNQTVTGALDRKVQFFLNLNRQQKQALVIKRLRPLKMIISQAHSEQDAPLDPDRWMGGGRQKSSSSSGEANMQYGRPKSNRFGTRPPSSSVGFPKRTASRLSSGVTQPQKAGQSILGISNINVMDRPITQQGVTGLRTATSRGPQFRQVLDSRYYEGLIRMKVKEIASEVSRLKGEIETETRQQSASQLYEKRVREVASELTKLQAQLSDYNLVTDKVNTGTERAQIDAEVEELRIENDRRAAELDEMFAQNRLQSEQIGRIESEIETEKNITNKIIQEMSEADRKKFEELSKVNEQLQAEIAEYQQQLDFLSNQKLEYEDRISGSQIKKETVRLYHKLREREGRKEALLEEERTRSTPAQEREQLLKKVKEDNAEMAAMERQITGINERIKKNKEELEVIEQDLEESRSDRHQKFKELKKREETMEQFLTTFEESKKNEIDRIGEMEEKIVKVLQHMSKNLLEGNKLPSRDEFHLMKENLALKQEESEKSKMTLDELNKRQEQLSENMKKFNDLERKIQEEMSTIQEKMVTMTEELKTFSDLDVLRDKAQERRDYLMAERGELLSKLESLTEARSELEKQNEALSRELNENETYIQLNNLEKKLKLLEQNNTSMREFLDSKKIEMDYEPLKNNALKVLDEYNRLLMSNHKK